jgi:aspartyl-tRNA(Asn)/glutamyl-tRNA(Gln) amidotransferase subunit A
LCGVVGFKPTYGRVPTTGITPLSWSLDHVGPLTRSVGDASLVYRVLAGERPPAQASSRGEQALDGLRVGILPDSALRLSSAIVLRAFQDVIESVAGRTRLVEVDTPALEWSRPAAGIITAVEAATYHYADLRARPLAFHRGIRSELRAAALLPATAYVRAQRVRGMVRDRFARLFEVIDVLLVPTTPVTALRRGDLEGRKLLGHFTQPFSFAGLPALTVPIDGPAERLPVGLTVVGRPFDDDLVLDVGIALEAIGVARTRRPTFAASAPAIS